MLARGLLDAGAALLTGDLDGALRAISPTLADLASKGITGVLGDLISEAIGALVDGLLGGFDLGGMIESVKGEISGVFTVLSGVLNNEPGCCETFAGWMKTFEEFHARLAENPIVQGFTDLMATISGVLGDVIALLVTAQIDQLMMMYDGAKAVFDLYMDAVEAGQDLVKGAADWIWDGVADALGLENPDGNIVDWLWEKASEVLARSGRFAPAAPCGRSPRGSLRAYRRQRLTG